MNNLNTIETLRKICGHNAVIDNEISLQSYNQDWDNKFNNKSICAVLPKNKYEVSEIAKYCNNYAIKIIPQGGNTGLVAGANPTSNKDEIILNLKKMNKIIDIDKYNYSIAIEAGVILQTLKETCSKKGFFFPIEITSSGSSQIGGNIATNAGGMNALKFGSMRDQLLGLEVVTADGSILELNSKMRKNNMGYDLKNLFCGSEGTLGIITSATLKLYPLSSNSFSVMVSFDNIKTLLNSYLDIRSEFSEILECCEFITETSFDLVLRHGLIKKHLFDKAGKYYLLLKFASKDLNRNLQDIIGNHLYNKRNYLDVLVPLNEKSQNELWDFREKITEAQKREGHVIHNDISIPINHISVFMNKIKSKFSSKKFILHTFGHLGDSNLHVNLIFNGGKNILKSEEKKVVDCINTIVINLEGSISAEHGIGRIKKDSFLEYSKENNIEVMKKIKKLFDPNNIMNPAKVFDI